MRIYRSLDETSVDFGPCALTIGNFDGVHAGHRRILRRVVEVARERGLKPSVMTFDPHPTHVVAPAKAPKLMTSPERRCELMAEEGIEQALILPFDSEIARLSPEDFVKAIVAGKLGAKAVLVGANFHFGHKQAGNVEVLEHLGRRYGFITEVVQALALRGAMVSSTSVRQLVESGKVARAWRMLQSPFSVEGNVVRGHGVGSKQTVPTLNLPAFFEVMPATGVYVTCTHDLDSTRHWRSVTNIGYRPTFDGRELGMETFVLEPYSGESPKRIRVEFLRRLRDEKKFASPEELKAQIMRDVARATAYFRRCSRF